MKVLILLNAGKSAGDVCTTAATMLPFGRMQKDGKVLNGTACCHSADHSTLVSCAVGQWSKVNSPNTHHCNQFPIWPVCWIYSLILTIFVQLTDSHFAFIIALKEYCFSQFQSLVSITRDWLWWIVLCKKSLISGFMWANDFLLFKPNEYIESSPDFLLLATKSILICAGRWGARGKRIIFHLLFLGFRSENMADLCIYYIHLCTSVYIFQIFNNESVYYYE